MPPAPSAKIPQVIESEEAVLGCMLGDRRATDIALEMLSEDDFYKPLHMNVFGALKELYESGQEIDLVSVNGYLTNKQLVGPTTTSDLIGIMGRGIGYPYVAQYAKDVQQAKAARDLMRYCQDALNEVTTGADPYQLAEELARSTLTIGGDSDKTQQAHTIEELEAMEEEYSRIIIPNLMNIDHRVIVTAKSGSGKSTLLKHIAMCSAQGIHPFRLQDIEPIRALAVDVENPIENITQTMGVLRKTLMERSPVYDPTRFRVYRRPGGMNVRNRRDRSDLKREIALHRPDLVVAGPVYKLTVRNPRETWEEAAGEFLRIWDDLRTKYEFGLILEAHVSKGTEDWTPQGSILLTQWAEVGLGLQVKKSWPDTTFIERFRGDRLQGLSWPKELRRDPQWLFKAIY